ncbi:MAG: hypothetical protein OXR66_05510 [Candidatus Woesearchaeota archaeon]|nr:hypothetical protein [Candidatus Woesearchaeota archaeon]
MRSFAFPEPANLSGPVLGSPSAQLSSFAAKLQGEKHLASYYAQLGTAPKKASEYASTRIKRVSQYLRDMGDYAYKRSTSFSKERKVDPGRVAQQAHIDDLVTAKPSSSGVDTGGGAFRAAVYGFFRRQEYTALKERAQLQGKREVDPRATNRELSIVEQLTRKPSFEYSLIDPKKTVRNTVKRYDPHSGAQPPKRKRGCQSRNVASMIPKGTSVYRQSPSVPDVKSLR